MNFKTYLYDFRFKEVNQLIEKELEADEFVVMCLAAEKFKKLCSLFPKTEQSLKYRALDRRNFFLKTMQEQEIQYGAHRDKKTGLKSCIKTIADEIII